MVCGDCIECNVTIWLSIRFVKTEKSVLSINEALRDDIVL